MQEPQILEVNRLKVKQDNGGIIAVTEVKLKGQAAYYRYEYQTARQLMFHTVSRQWWPEVKREPVPRAEWDKIAIAKGNLPEDFEDITEPF